MKLWKKIVLAPFAFTAVAASVQAVADDQITHTVKLKTTVPTITFYVEPETKGWIGEDQLLEYVTATDTITSLSKGFKYKHSAGSIDGSLSDSAVLSSKDGKNIKLTVRFDDVELDTKAKTVISSAKAAEGGNTKLVISAVKPTDGYSPGEYTGSVELVFDPVLDQPEP